MQKKKLSAEISILKVKIPPGMMLEKTKFNISKQ